MTDPVIPSDADDVLAAEYVIGVLEAAERRDASRRMQVDAAFAARVSVWEAHLDDLNADYGTQTPPAHVKVRIDTHLFPAPRRGWFNWMAAGLVTATLLLGIGIYQLTVSTQADLQAQLQSDGSAYAFAVSVDLDSSRIDVTVLNSDDLSGGVFELWLVPADGAPVSLGTFAEDGQLAVQQGMALAVNATLAVSLEPFGGSPTGAPTGPVVAIGALEDV